MDLHSLWVYQSQARPASIPVHQRSLRDLSRRAYRRGGWATGEMESPAGYV